MFDLRYFKVILWYVLLAIVALCLSILGVKIVALLVPFSRALAWGAVFIVILLLVVMGLFCIRKVGEIFKEK